MGNKIMNAPELEQKEVTILETTVSKIEEACKKATTQQEMVLDYLAGRMAEDISLAEDFAQEHKTFAKCWSYITDNARKQAVSGCACIEDAVVYEWAEDYIRKDDKAEEEAKAKAEVERRAKAEKAKADREAKAAKKHTPKKGEVQGQSDMMAALTGTQSTPVDKSDPVPSGSIAGQTSLFSLLSGGEADAK